MKEFRRSHHQKEKDLAHLDGYDAIRQELAFTRFNTASLDAQQQFLHRETCVTELCHQYTYVAESPSYYLHMLQEQSERPNTSGGHPTHITRIEQSTRRYRRFTSVEISPLIRAEFSIDSDTAHLNASSYRSTVGYAYQYHIHVYALDASYGVPAEMFPLSGIVEMRMIPSVLPRFGNGQEMESLSMRVYTDSTIHWSPLTEEFLTMIQR